MVGILRQAHAQRLTLRSGRAQAEEAEIGIIRREVHVHRADSLGVCAQSVADLDGTAIGQQGIVRGFAGVVIGGASSAR